jgi:hypothetical protein
LSSICGVGIFVLRLDTHYALALTCFCTSETKIFMFCSLTIRREPRSSVSILLHFAAKNFWSTQSFETHDVEMIYSWEVVLAMMWKLSAPNLKIVHILLHHYHLVYPWNCHVEVILQEFLSFLLVDLLNIAIFCTWLCAPVGCWMFCLTYLPNTSIPPLNTTLQQHIAVN